MKKSIEKKNFFLAYAALIYSMFLLFALINSFCGKTSERWTFIYMFTQQSNIVALVWFLSFGITTFLKLPRLEKLTNNVTVMTAVTVYISITFFIVAFVLSPVYAGKFNPMSSFGEFALHNMTTVMMWLYFFLVKGDGKMKPVYCLYILIYPLIYVIVNLIVGYNVNYESGDAAFAYNFINPNSYPNFFVYILVLLLLILIFGMFGFLLMRLKNYINRNYHEEISQLEGETHEKNS